MPESYSLAQACDNNESPLLILSEQHLSNFFQNQAVYLPCFPFFFSSSPYFSMLHTPRHHHRKRHSRRLDHLQFPPMESPTATPSTSRTTPFEWGIYMDTTTVIEEEEDVAQSSVAKIADDLSRDLISSSAVGWGMSLSWWMWLGMERASWSNRQ